MRLETLATPALVLDSERLAANLARMAGRMAGLGVAVRPHLKTAKSAEVARRALAAGARGITVSTLKEAAYFLDHGIDDVTYAVGITPDRLEPAAALMGRGAKLSILTDDPDVAAAIDARGQALGVIFRVLIEIDSGGARAGLDPEGDELFALARRLDRAAGARFAGLLTHAGHSYHCHDVAEVAAVARQERAAVAGAARRLAAQGLAPGVVSAGSTPTAVHAEDLSGVTEMRPGVYMFNDLDQLALGSCRREDLALTVLASVIGHNRARGHLLIDAGALALSKDVSATEFRAEIGYGEVCEPSTLAPIPGLYVRDLDQEHGLIPVADGSIFDRLPVGARLRVLPNHACITAAAYDHYDVVEDQRVVDRWGRVNGW